jgi:hypothetical protein
MRSIAWSVACAVVAALSTAIAAKPAEAGLDFTDTATLTAVTAGVTFNGSGSIGASTTLSPGFNNPSVVTLASTGAGIPSCTVDFSYALSSAGNPNVANYAASVGNPAYSMLIQLGTITGTTQLNTISFTEPGSGLNTLYSINQVLTSADSGRLLFIQVPSAGPNSIPLTERDFVQAVRLNFGFTSGSASSLQIVAVVNPEPGTIALFGLGLAGLVGAVRARRKNRARAQTV